MNWYLQNKLRHGIAKWDILWESFLLNFSFKDGFKCIDEVIHEIKDDIFRTPENQVEWVQPA